MKNSCLFFILIFIFSFANAQTKLDSLYSVWEDKTQADSSRVNAFKDYIWDGYLFSQPDSALVLAETLIEFSRSKDYKLGSALALRIQGISYAVKSDYPKALDYLQRSLKILEDMGDKRGIAGSLGNIGIIYDNQGNYSKALEYYQRSLKIKEEIGNKQGIGKTLNNIGIIYYNQSDYSKALEYYQRSLKIKEEIGDKKRGIASSLGNIGTIYDNQGDYPKALDYFQRSLKILEDIGDKQGVSGILNNIGSIYSDQGDYIKALDYFQKSLKIFEEIGDKKGVAFSLNMAGITYKYQGDYVKAQDYLQRALKINEEIGNKKGVAQSLHIIGNIYAKQGDHINALENCKKSLDLAEKISAILVQKESCECLYDAYKALGNGNKALEYHEQMLVLNDSLQTEETAKKLQQMEFAKTMLADSLVLVEKDLKVEMAHQIEVRKKDKNRNLAIGAGVFFLLLSGGFYSRWRYVKRSRAIIEKEKDRSENLLLNILPAEIAEELKLKGSADARDFDLISVLFSDFKGFIKVSEKLSAKELIAEINHCFMAFDHICEKHGIEKIKTIGDAYMAAGGLPVPSEDSIKNTVLVALDMQSFITNRIVEKRAKNEVPFEMRLGIHTGPVVAGIVGVKKFQYDIWGDTVNTASRMESSGEIGKVNISENTYALIKDDPQFNFESRGKIQAKGKGEIEMYFVTKAS